MKLIDLHADTITALYYDKNNWEKEQEFILDIPANNLDINSLAIDLHKLRTADSLAQFFVLWLNIKNCLKYQISPWNLFLKQYNQLREQIDRFSSQINFVTNLDELNTTQEQNKLAGFTCVEEGAFISSIEQLSEAHKLGVRYITLVWNYETHIGVPSAIDQSRGLTPFGCEMVEAMQKIGIMVDVSHLSDRGVIDVLSIAKKPIIASHSNARALCNHTRNLPDELIRGIAKNGGVIGVNCVPYFLDEKDSTIRVANIIRHIQHIYNLAGIDALAIGNDFDGFTASTPEFDEITTIADMPKLISALLEAKFNSSQIEKIFSKNILRVMSDTCAFAGTIS
jgi:membrane dipeptidase